MVDAYAGGSTGVFASGLIWLLASFATYYYSLHIGIYTLIVGGMMIFPLSIVFSKVLKLSGKHSNDNPLGALAIESTIILLLGIYIAYVFIPYKPEFFFSILLIIIGGRYLLFSTLYGMKIYWLLGAALIGSGIIFINIEANYILPVMTGGIVELVGAVIVYKKYQETVHPKA